MNILKNKNAKNAFWIIIGKAAQSLIGLIVGMLTARYLGPSNYGLISYASSIVAFVVPIMQLGFSNIMVQELTNHQDEEGKIVGTATLFSVISALACIIGIIIFTFVVDHNEPITNCVVILYSILLVFQAFDLIQYWFQAKLLSKYISLSSLVAYIVVAVYKVILLVTGANVFWFALSNSIDYLLIAIILLVVYLKKGGQKLKPSLDVAKRMFNSSKHYIVSSLMVTIFAQTDRIMLKLMINEEAVGFYTAGVSCAGITSFVFSGIIDSMRPTIFSYKKIGDEDAYERNISRTYCLVIYLAIAQSVMMTVFARFIIYVLYGKDYSAAVLTLQIIVWYTTFSYMGAVRNIWILGEKKQKYLWILNLGGAVTNVALNFVLIPLWGIYGAAAASLITQIFTNVIMNVIVWPYRYNNTLILKGLNPMLILGLFKKEKVK